MKRFKHSGKLGDIIWSLPFVKFMGGGKVYLECDEKRDQKVSDRNLISGLRDIEYQHIRPFLLEQEYITEVDVYDGEEVDFDLNRFREFRGNITFNLVQNYFYAFGIDPPAELDSQVWLSSRQASRQERRIVVSRTSRYLLETPAHNPFYDQLVDRGLDDQAIFIGLPEECAAFNREYGSNVPLFPFGDLSAVAAEISSCELWVGNENLIGAIAEGFKKTCVREIRKDREELNCVFRRANLFYI